MEIKQIDVLDKGYVRLTNVMGDDVSVINAARVSFDKETAFQEDGTLKEKDVRLMKFLVRNNELSVFRHATVQFEIYMPLMAARQFWKYVVAASHIDDGTCLNESSRRYITEEPTFYIPAETEWRSAPEDKKQGSGENLPVSLGEIATEDLSNLIAHSDRLYNYWIEAGMAPEQARLFLPAYGLYVRMRSTMSLAAFMHFLKERLGHRAQYEIWVYAHAMKNLVYEHFPETMDVFLGTAEFNA